MNCSTTLVFAVLLTSTVAAVANDPPVRTARLGELWFTDAAKAAPYRNAFRKGLRELGYIEGRNMVIVVRYANADSARVPTLVAELLAEKVDVMFLAPTALLSAKQATTTVPIVSAGFTDPVAEGFAQSLSRPGGNMTGLAWQSVDSAGKRLQMALEVVPKLKEIGILFDPNDLTTLNEAEAARLAAIEAGLKVRMFPVRDRRDLDGAFADMKRKRPQALYMAMSGLMIHLREPIIGFTLTNRIPLITETRDWAEAGCLLTYGVSVDDLWRRAAGFVDKILKGAKPGDLPIQQPTKFELIVNQRTAERLGITIPRSILLQADEVIE